MVFLCFLRFFFTDFYGRITLVAGITEIYGHFTYVSVKFMVILRLGVRFYGLILKFMVGLRLQPGAGFMVELRFFWLD